MSQAALCNRVGWLECIVVSCTAVVCQRVGFVRRRDGSVLCSVDSLFVWVGGRV